MTETLSESNIRPIEYVANSVPTREGAGVRLKRAFGNRTNVNLDPFLLLDHMRSDNPKDYAPGFPDHPHRGMETVTYMIEGEMSHEDSLGNKGELRDGEIQWMTAGSGIIHQEMPSQRREKMLHGLQLWVNLPSDHKMRKPRYQDIKSTEIPEESVDNNVNVKVLAGEFNGTEGPVDDVVCRPTYLDMTIDQETSFTHEVNPDHTVIAYVLDGEGYFDINKQRKLEKEQLVVFGQGEKVQVEAGDDPLRFLLMSGKPINEPVAWHGPIVMNTRQELATAFTELQNDSFIKHEYRL